MICMTKKSFKKEHKKLLSVLKRKDPKALNAERKEQAEEMHEELQKESNMRNSHEALHRLIEAKRKAEGKKLPDYDPAQAHQAGINRAKRWAAGGAAAIGGLAGLNHGVIPGLAGAAMGGIMFAGPGYSHGVGKYRRGTKAPNDSQAGMHLARRGLAGVLLPPASLIQGYHGAKELGESFRESLEGRKQRALKGAAKGAVLAPAAYHTGLAIANQFVPKKASHLVALRAISPIASLGGAVIGGAHGAMESLRESHGFLHSMLLTQRLMEKEVAKAEAKGPVPITAAPSLMRFKSKEYLALPHQVRKQLNPVWDAASESFCVHPHKYVQAHTGHEQAVLNVKRMANGLGLSIGDSAPKASSNRESHVQTLMNLMRS